MKKIGGFVLIHFVAVIPLFLAIGLALSSVLAFSQSTQDLKTLCYRSQIQTLEEVKRSLHLLLKQNALAVFLKAKDVRLKIALAGATAALNGPAITLYSGLLVENNSKRKTLDTFQKTIIRVSEERILLNQLELKRGLGGAGGRLSDSLSPVFLQNLSLVEVNHPHLAVKSVYDDLAPPYGLTADFIEAQALTAGWRMEFLSSEKTSRFFKLKNDFYAGCSTTINNMEDAWPTVTRAVKLSSKP